MELTEILEQVKEGRLEVTGALAAACFPPQLLGPTWKVTAEGAWLLPEHSLGWEVLRWTRTWLVNPDSGKPWEFTPEQARFILWLYAVDKHGKRIYKKAVLQRLKGWGKDPVAVAIGLCELLGPVIFDGWRENGRPKGRRRRTSLVQIVAVNKDQGLKNAMHFAPDIIPKRTIEEYNLEVQKEIVQIKGRPGCRLEAVSSSDRGAEGNRPHFAILDEIHHWVPSRGGEALYETIRNNVKKVKGTVLAITNAYVPGEDSILERIRYAVDQFHAGLAADPGWLYDSLEAHPDAPFDMNWGPHIVRMCAGDSHEWVGIEDAAEDFADTSMGASRQQRMWYNRIVAAEDAVWSEAEWDAIRAEGMTGTKSDLSPGDEIVLGFDGGKTDDATALVAIRLRDKLVVPLAIWQRPGQKKRGDDAWEVDRTEVSGEVHQAFFNYKVKAFYADVALWESEIRDWSDNYRKTLLVEATAKSAIGYDMRGNKQALVLGHEALMTFVRQHRILHNGDKRLRNHALNAKRDADNPYGVSFRKESSESPKKVDAYAATLLAFLAMNAVLESNKPDPNRYSRRLIQH